MPSALAIAADLPTARPPADAIQSFAPGAQVAVQLPLPLAAYDYRVPESGPLAAGDIVEVPLGRRFEIGVVWGPGTGEVAPEKLREIVQRVELPGLPLALRRFVDWVA